jgi:phenylalanyl-tRNA synthetase beta chain
MKIPLSWLKEHLSFNQTAEEIAELLTLAGLEVEKVDHLRPSFSGVVVAKILAVTAHPNADKLRLATVFNGSEEVTLVCGAPNCRPGITVALANPGAVLTDETGKKWTVKKSRIRDVDSPGMLCSAKELNLSEESEGIIEFSPELQAGADVVHLFEETILEIALTPNLGHCMSMIGIARELAAILKCTLTKPHISFEEEQSVRTEDKISLHIEDKKNCLRYACRFLYGVQVAPSPDWLKRRLEVSGMRSVNNVVDIGNYVMLEYGQPLHLFDYDAIADKKLIVSSDAPYSTFLALDEKTYEIPPRALLICDPLKPLAIAGIIGSKDSSVSGTTTNILIESAYFSPESIRRTSKALKVRTEASQRFEREIDSQGVLEALSRAAQLLQLIAGGKIAKGALDVFSHAFTPREISCRPSRINTLLGTKLSTNEIISLFERLEIKIKSETAQTLLVKVPTYRNDLKEEIDLIEEVARLYGYNNFSQKNPQHITSSLLDAPLYRFEKEVRERLLREGLQECLTCNLISPKLAELTAEAGSQERLISVLYPSSIDQSILRPTLLPGLLEVIKKNQDHQMHDISAFEVGRIHFKQDGQYIEQTTAAIILAGKSRPHHWEEKPKEVDFFDLKGMVESLLETLGVEAAFEPSHLHNFHPFRQARVKRETTYLGVLGEMHPSHLASLEITGRVFYAELNLDELLALRKRERRFFAFSRYPGSERDWTLSLKMETPIENVFEAIRGTSSRVLEKILLLDLYKSDQIGKDRKNATIRFFYRDLQKTIALDIVDREHARITEEVAKKLRDHLL